MNCPRQSLHQRWHGGSKMTWKLPPQSAQHPVNHPGKRRTTSEQCPNSWREMSHTTPVNVRIMVSATVRRRLGNSHRRSRSRQVGVHEAVRVVSGLASGQFPGSSTVFPNDYRARAAARYFPQLRISHVFSVTTPFHVRELSANMSANSLHLPQSNLSTSPKSRLASVRGSRET
jgi:hypothetical protein